jgi:hypothetical protein
MRFLLFKLCTQAALLCLLAAQSHAQWLVYELRLTPQVEQSVNFNVYSGTYLITPIEGGKSSMIHVTEEGGRYYTVSPQSGRLYMAANTQARKMVFSALSVSGTSHTVYQATGSLTTTVSYLVNGERRNTQVADTLAGSLLTSDDESQITALPADGSFGVVGEAKINGKLRQDLTRILNDTAPTEAAAIQSITTLLQRYGYRPEEELLLAAQQAQAEASAAAAAEQSATNETESPVEPLQPVDLEPPTGSLFPLSAGTKPNR